MYPAHAVCGRGLCPAAFFSADFQHGQAEVGADDGDFSLRGSPILQGQVGRAGADVEDRQVAFGRHKPYGFSPPRAIDTQRQHAIEQIIASGDFAEHLPYAG
jgi:hypothetical protein